MNQDENVLHPTKKFEKFSKKYFFQKKLNEKILSRMRPSKDPFSDFLSHKDRTLRKFPDQHFFLSLREN